MRPYSAAFRVRTILRPQFITQYSTESRPIPITNPIKARLSGWFSSSVPRPFPSDNTLKSTTPPKPPQPDHNTPEERQLNLGSTLRTLQHHLPGLLTHPLPSNILSPSVHLVLFPSTHPHLPVVHGRMAYIAALWTAPVAWGRLPGVGVRLKIISERMVGEEFVVRWQTTSTGRGQGEVESDVDRRLAAMDSGLKVKGENTALDVFKILRERKKSEEDENDEEGFGGLFVFSFDEKGRIAKHVIEHTDRGRDSEGGTIISVTEWLLRKAKEGAAGASGNGGLVMGCHGKEKD